MKTKITSLLIALALAFLTSGCAAVRPNATPFRALVLAERGDQHEPMVAAALIWLKTVAQQDNFTFDTVENPDKFTKQAEELRVRLAG